MQFQLQEAANKSGMLFAIFLPNGKAVSEIAPPKRGKAIYRPQQLKGGGAHWPLCLATGGRVFVADPSTLGRHVAATYMLCMQMLCLWGGRATACRTLEPQTAVWSPKLENNGFLRK